MTKFKLSILTLLTIFVTSLIFISCSNEEPTETTYTNELKTSGTLLFNQSTNKFSSKTSKTDSENTTEHNVELSFISENPIPVFDSNEELQNYLELNSSNINGTILLKIDGEIAYESIVINGQKTKTSRNKIQYSAKSYPCTFDGLSHCTQDRIDAMNWFDTALCIVEGFGCVATNFVSCGVDNC